MNERRAALWITCGAISILILLFLNITFSRHIFFSLISNTFNHHFEFSTSVTCCCCWSCCCCCLYCIPHCNRACMSRTWNVWFIKYVGLFCLICRVHYWNKFNVLRTYVHTHTLQTSLKIASLLSSSFFFFFSSSHHRSACDMAGQWLCFVLFCFINDHKRAAPQYR